MKKVVLAAAIAAISSGALAQTSIPVNVSGLVVPAQEAPEVPEEEKNCTVSSDSGSINLAFNDVEQGSEATSESDSLTVSECSGATVSLSTTEDGAQTSTIKGFVGITETEIPLTAKVAGEGTNLFEQSASIDSDSTEIEVTASLTAEQTSEQGAVAAQGMVYVTIDGADTPAPEQTPVEQVTSEIGGSAIGGIVPTAPSVEPEEGLALVGAVVEGAVDAVSGVVEAVISQFEQNPISQPGGDNPLADADPAVVIGGAVEELAEQNPISQPGGDNPLADADPAAVIGGAIEQLAEQNPISQPGGDNPLADADPAVVIGGVEELAEQNPISQQGGENPEFDVDTTPDDGSSGFSLEGPNGGNLALFTVEID